MARHESTPRRVGGQKQNTFFGGAAILAVGIMVVKVIGMFYKIPLVWIIGDHSIRCWARSAARSRSTT